MRLSITLSGFESAEHAIALAEAADQHSLDAVHCAEHLGFASGIITASQLLRRTARTDIGIVGLTPSARHPGVTAMEIATLASHAPGRIRCAVGTGVPALLHRLGLPTGRPLESMRTFINTLRSLLAGNAITVDTPNGAFDNYALAAAHNVPIDVCAIRPRMLDLSAEVADGVSLSIGASRHYLRQAVHRIEARLAALGRPRADFRITAIVAVAVDDNPRTARENLRTALTAGLTPELADVLCVGAVSPSSANDRDRVLTDKALDDLALIGTFGELPLLLERYRDVGIDELSLGWLTPNTHQIRDIAEAAQAWQANLMIGKL